MTPLKYRADIDGLRAIAVLGVVIYHAFPRLIPGGFIGVDIFFVISGYLISGILYKGLKANGGDGNFSPFSFREFYARRIRRLFPALITMLVLTMAYGWLILLPDEFQQLGKHIAAGTLFIQNIVFWQESGYFDTAASLKPMLHLWSLAVEEQFYIFFPPLLLLIWKRKWPLVIILGVLLVVSIVGNLWMSAHGVTADFFLTPYRAWEFLGGSLLAWWHYDKGHEEDVPFYWEALSWGGALLLILGMAFIRTGDPYPGWRAILPVAGTLLLMEGGRGAWVNRKILSNPAVVWVGLISYPLYLFHWPALSFVHIVKGESPKPVHLADALIVALTLTVLTYYFIEKKIRHNKSKWVLPVLVGAFLATGVVGLMAWGKTFPAKKRPVELIKYIEAAQDRNTLAEWAFLPANKNILVTTTGGHGKQTLFIGDSNIQQYAPRIRELLKNNAGNQRGAIMISVGGVPPIPGVTQQQPNGHDEMIKEFRETADSNPQVDRVVIAARWGYYFQRGSGWKIDGISLEDEPARRTGLEKLDSLIADLVTQGKKVTLVAAVPVGKYLDPKNMCPRGFNGGYSKKPRAFTREEFLKENPIIKDIIAIGKRNNVEVIDPLDTLCITGVCVAENGDGPIHYDEGHLRPGYVREHVKYLDGTVAP